MKTDSQQPPLTPLENQIIAFMEQQDQGKARGYKHSLPVHNRDQDSYWVFSITETGSIKLEMPGHSIELPPSSHRLKAYLKGQENAMYPSTANLLYGYTVMQLQLSLNEISAPETELIKLMMEKCAQVQSKVPTRIPLTEGISLRIQDQEKNQCAFETKKYCIELNPHTNRLCPLAKDQPTFSSK
ncbi:MAG: hypothetical protein ACRCXC_03390 [Legionella sp.]